jgi:sterol 3beta-glucosyltransferase
MSAVFNCRLFMTLIVYLEYTCWLIKTVLLKGCVFVTENHVCYYSLLPKDEVCTHLPVTLILIVQGQVQKSGFLSKKSSTSKTFWTYWFVLKDGILTYYDNSKDLYLPLGSIDLKTIQSIKQSERNPSRLKLLSDRKKYTLQADTLRCALDWKRTFEAAWFRARHHSDHVRVILFHLKH